MLKRMLLSALIGLGISPPRSTAALTHPFEEFLNSFVPQVASKSTQLNKAFWMLETTGSEDAASLVAALSSELSLLFNSTTTYQSLLQWEKEGHLHDPLLKRQLNLLIRSFKENTISKELLEELSEKEARLSLSYANFRATLDDKPASENAILDVLKHEKDPAIRKKAWEASKEIGSVLAPQILELVKLRNKAAKSLGYDNYFQMQLDLKEVNEKDLFQTLDNVANLSDSAYKKALEYIEHALSEKFSVPREELGPWAWGEPFGQEDPLDLSELDSLVKDTDLVEASKRFYENMGIDVSSILKKSDLFEREGKNQHAFCINIDRGADVRTLNNVKPSLKWLETLLHELGHAIYEIGFDKNLPWLLKEPPGNLVTTEAMALLAGRRAYLASCLSKLPTYSQSQDSLIAKAEQSLQRRQLIFSRWVLVMTYFERELYKKPDQDLNKLWWGLVSKYQKITPPSGREKKCDWAAKYHIGLAPVYYYCYLLGEFFASSVEETLIQITGSNDLDTKAAGEFLQEKLFFPANRMNWDHLIKHVTGSSLSCAPWIHQFAQD